MPLAKPSPGISSRTIMIFGLLALTVVLVNALAMLQSGTDGRLAAERKIVLHCGGAHEKFPPQCLISRIFRCSDTYILQSDCLGVGSVVVDTNDTFLDWCGYNSLDTPIKDCAPYLGTESVCLQHNNLCLQR